MKFRALLLTPFRVLTFDHSDCHFEFTKSHYYCKRIRPKSVVDGNLRHGVHYKLTIRDNIDRRLRYEITINDGRPITMTLNKYNEIKLKWVHKRYLIQKEPLAFVALIIAVLSLIATIIIGIFQIKQK